MCFAFLWVPACGNDGGFWRGMTGVHPAGMICSPSPSDPLLISPWEGEGDGSRERGCNRSGVLCFSLGSRLRGNDGGLARERALFTLTLGPPLNLPLGGGGRWRGRGDLTAVKDGSGVLCFSLGSRLRGNDGGSAGMGGWRE